jgi:arginase
MITRREALVTALAATAAGQSMAARECSPPILILAPSNLGLRPNEDGSEPGTWRAPETLVDLGLARSISAIGTWRLARPKYVREEMPGTRIRNGAAIRSFSMQLGSRVSEALTDRCFPVVIGGDCSILLGCLLGARSQGRAGLVHIDGHSDFFHPGNYDSSKHLGAAAGMDLALATGRGEALLTAWPTVDGPLVSDDDALQVGERNALDPDYDKYYGDIRNTRITRILIQDVQKDGIDASLARIAKWIEKRGLARTWLHVDLDVLDETAMPAVDSPGSPGLSYDDLARLIAGLRQTGSVLGVDFSIYDPDRDPARIYAPRIVDCISRALKCS